MNPSNYHETVGKRKTGNEHIEELASQEKTESMIQFERKVRRLLNGDFKVSNNDGTAQHSPQELTSNTDNKGAKVPGYYQVRREWLSDRTTPGAVMAVNGGKAPDVTDGKAPSSAQSAMLQRWIQEPQRKEPYNNVAAVALGMRADCPKVGVHGGCTDPATFGSSAATVNGVESESVGVRQPLGP
ncbi:uncharacterized protein BDZ99DRAFT_248125 [Mytilinidion resinicola]|uniref:Uncharacterized protein n=1 Tax=Mytilinidion resinicola TaxID=574789 RepID=A0A6A6YYN1_9PEZI|nr:uncharacterized protein BDZ99DRAFT_248125 [Mytilinidion resinicola]KAF2813035.1 hypothetical protein BDZ99DRAFT_248125 [Mytilinidion resinicola]